MLNSINYAKKIFYFIILFCTTLTAEDIKPTMNQKSKKHVVVAMPFRPNMPLDPHWYTAEYVQYIANLLPSEKYTVSGYFVSLENISEFLNDMKILYEKEKDVCVFNVCDGGEWDGYPGVSVLVQWEKHPVNGLIPITGADAEFIWNSDDKTKMTAFLKENNLKTFPQILLNSKMIEKTDFDQLLEKDPLNQEWPLFCKLNVGAGALGIGPESICHNVEELAAQVQKVHKAFPNSDIIIQPYLPGPEYTVLVLKDRIYVAVRRDFHNPYNLMLEDYLTGINKPEDEITYLCTPQDVQNLALKAIQAIPGKHHYTRVDLRSDAKGNTYVLDINDRPGFGTPSTVKCMLDFHHLNEGQLLQDILEENGYKN